jgi:5-methylcytosine-specific restriction endonuclease McrA
MAKLKREIIHESTGGRCWYCGKTVTLVEMHIDHAHPRSLGGSRDIENLLPACRSCNCSKQNKTIEEYREWLQWKRISVEPFTNAQILYLRSQGFELPPFSPYPFWGESREG